MTSNLHIFLAASAILAVGGVVTLTLPFLCGWSSILGYRLSSTAAFVGLFVFRYWRFVVHLVAFLLYRPRPVSLTPRYSPGDCTVIVPTIEPGTAVFRQCIESIAACRPAAILVVTVGTLQAEAWVTLSSAIERFPGIDIRIRSCNVANKRRQINQVANLVKTPVTILADSTVNWKHQTFLEHILAPFDDANVALVGTNKRVVRESHGTSTFEGLRASFFNFLGCTYLERHNYEMAASSCIDSGVFAISGRTCAVLSEILQDPAYLKEFINERFRFLGCLEVGPIVADDDNFLTRWCVAHGRGVRIQYAPEAVVETVLGEYPRFIAQCQRWARTTFRSNPRSLLTARLYRDQPWSWCGVHIAGITNLALFVDGLLLALNPGRTWPLVGWILATKVVKLVPHFRRHPRDLAFFPLYVAWAYVHSLIKLHALLTFWDVSWSGRNLESVEKKANVGLPPAPSSSEMDALAAQALAEVNPNVAVLRRKAHGKAVAADEN